MDITAFCDKQQLSASSGPRYLSTCTNISTTCTLEIAMLGNSKWIKRLLLPNCIKRSKTF